MEALERFVGSPSAAICVASGSDPAAFLTDDVLALNLRAALMVARNRTDEPATFEEMFAGE